LAPATTWPCCLPKSQASPPWSLLVSLGNARLNAEDETQIHVELVGLDGQQIALADASCDAALCTFTLCTVPDPLAALAEIARVVRPGGRLHLLEHGLAPDENVARWQRLLNPIERRLAGGCHLTRDPLALTTAAGCVPEWTEQTYGPGPAPWMWLTSGVFQIPQ
jgi:SAM-dependent methyltransferase